MDIKLLQHISEMQQFLKKITHIDIDGKKEIYDAYSENTKRVKKRL